MESRFTQGMSPASLSLAYLDWLIHLSHSPGKISELAENISRKTQALALWSTRAAVDPNTPPLITPLAQDRRFKDPAWNTFPFNVMAQSFLMREHVITSYSIHYTKLYD